MRRLVAVALWVGGGVTACEAPPSKGGERVVHTIESLRGAPERLLLSGTELSLEVEAWRSFQPTFDRVENRLIAVLRVKAAGGGVPGALAIDTVWLVRGGEVVPGAAREEHPREDGAGTVEFVLRDGPMWAPGDSIDVVASIVGVGRAAGLLRAPRVAIARVD